MHTWCVNGSVTVVSGQGTPTIDVNFTGSSSAAQIYVTANDPAATTSSFHLGQVLANGHAESGDMSGWTVITETGSGSPQGWAGGVRTGVGFGTSNTLGEKAQEIDLIAAGYTAAQLDASPPIHIGERFGDPTWATWQSAGYAFLSVELRDANHKPVAAWNYGDFGSGGVFVGNGVFAHTFTAYPAGVRFLYWAAGATEEESEKGKAGSENPEKQNETSYIERIRIQRGDIARIALKQQVAGRKEE